VPGHAVVEIRDHGVREAEPDERVAVGRATAAHEDAVARGGDTYGEQRRQGVPVEGVRRYSWTSSMSVP
jgi:hypothetical protein